MYTLRAHRGGRHHVCKLACCKTGRAGPGVGCVVPSCLQGWWCEEAKGAVPVSPELQGVTLMLDAAENRRVWCLLLTSWHF